MKLKRLIIPLLFLLTPLLCPGGPEENWPTYMGNQYLTGNNDGIMPEGEEVLWKFGSEGRVYNPVSVNDRVFVVSTDGHLYCLDLRTGAVIWKYKAEGALTRMVVINEGRVYLPAGRYLYCLDEVTGELLWGRRDPSVGFYGTPTVAEGKIFYGNRKGFFARELQNGHMEWEKTDIYTYRGFPAYWNGMVYTVSKEFQKEAARLVALSASDGSLRWSVRLENVSNIYSPVVYNGRLYLGYGKKLSVFDAESSEPVFERVFLSDIASHPVFSQGRIFLALAEGAIISVDPRTGSWFPVYSVPYPTQFAVVGSSLCIPLKDGAGGIAVVDAVTGRELRRIGRGIGAPSDITVSRGVALVPVKNRLVALGEGRFFDVISMTSTPGEAEIFMPSSESREPEPGPAAGEKRVPGKVSATADGDVTVSAPLEGSGGVREPALSIEPEPGAEGAAAAGTAADTKGAGSGITGAYKKPVFEVPEAALPDEKIALGYEIDRTGSGVTGAPSQPGAFEPYEEEAAEAAPVPSPGRVIVRGSVFDERGRALSGTVEATTKTTAGVEIRRHDFTDGKFTIEIPRQGETDLILSSEGYTFETITLPDEKAIDDLTTMGLEVTLSRPFAGASMEVRSIHFAVGKADLEPHSIPTLRLLLDLMKRNPSIKIGIAGHTDSTGKEEFNLALSRLRADAVAAWLVKNGVSSTRITTEGFGDTVPVAGNDTEEGRRKNRRTEIKVLEN